MITITLQDGRAIDLAEDTEISIGGESFVAGDVLTLLLIEPVVTLLEGRVTGTAYRRRGLKFTDGPTGIQTIVGMQSEEAELLGKRLLDPKVEVFRSLPGNGSS